MIMADLDVSALRDTKEIDAKEVSEISFCGRREETEYII